MSKKSLVVKIFVNRNAHIYFLSLFSNFKRQNWPFALSHWSSDRFKNKKKEHYICPNTMFLRLFLFSYCCVSTGLIIFLFRRLQVLKKWYRDLLVNNKTTIHVENFFKMVNPVIGLFKQKLLALVQSKTKKMTDPVFQFRFVLW